MAARPTSIVAMPFTPNLPSGETGERGNQWPTNGLGRTPRDRGEAQHQREPDS